MFIYFIEAQENAPLELDALAHAFDGEPAKRYNTAGLNDKPGYLLADKSVSLNLLRLDKQQQTWKHVDGIWYCRVVDSEPAAYARPKMLKGEDVEINGQLWTIPQAVTFEEVAENEIAFRYLVSRHLDVDESGELTYGEVEDRYKPLFDIALKWYQFEDSRFKSDGEYFRAAATAIGYNYRLGLVECVMLKLISLESARAIVETCAAASVYAKLQKKTRGPGSNTTDGKPAETISTG